MIRSTTFGKAVVVGGSMAGLLAAKACAESFEHVTVLERDDAAPRPEARKGVPQGRHVHALLARGNDVIETFFPGITDQLVADGAVPIDPGREMYWHHFGGWHVPVDAGFRWIFLSRPLLEHHVRRRLLESSNVEFRGGVGATALVERGGTIAGVAVRPRTGHAEAETVEADLVVDASGRGSQAPKWFQKLGLPAPREEVLGADVYYATRIFKRTREQAPHVCVIYPEPPSKMGGFFFAIDGDRWIATLFGLVNVRPPTDSEGWFDYAKRLAEPEIFERVSKLEAITDAVAHHATPSRRRYFESADPPTGFIATGDAVAAFNPTFGQGMSVGAMDAEVLGEAAITSRDIGELCKSAQRGIGRVVDTPWEMATSEDLRFDEVEGERSWKRRLTQWYTGKVMRGDQPQSRNPPRVSRGHELARAAESAPQTRCPKSARGGSLGHQGVD